MAYHALGRAKPYSLGTLNEGLAHTAYYGIALAYACGPLYRFGLLPSGTVRLRRPLGITGVCCAGLHVLATLIPLRSKFGWDYLTRQHWDLTVLGLVCLALALWMARTSLGNSVQRLGRERWARIQWIGLALLPLALAHFLVLGKFGKWMDWFQGRDTNPVPSGTIIIFAAGVLVIALRVVDAVCHGKADAGTTAG